MVNAKGEWPATAFSAILILAGLFIAALGIDALVMGLGVTAVCGAGIALTLRPGQLRLACWAATLAAIGAATWIMIF